MLCWKDAVIHIVGEHFVWQVFVHDADRIGLYYYGCHAQYLVSNLLSCAIVHSWRRTLAWKRRWYFCYRRALSDTASMRSILAAIPQGRWGKIGSKFGVRRYSRDSSWTFGRFEEILHCLINTNASEWYFVACLNSVFIHELLSYVWFCTSGSYRRAMYLRMFWA